ncbi:MAG: nitroreductase family deazaflavin-dependent oxidoreductase [Nitrososphaerales archaeon]
MPQSKQVVATYRANFTARMVNAFVSFFLKVGVKFGSTALLTVKGRKTGVPHTNPVLVVQYDEQRYLIAAYGTVNWVRNLRVSREATLFHDKHSEVIAASEISPQEAGPILKLGLASYPSITRSYFQAKVDSPIEEFQADATRHPVFKISDSRSK